MPKQKVIFLDIDGVLNSAKYAKHEFEAKGNKFVGLLGIDPKAVQILEDLVEQSGANIVISSSWRIGRTLEDLQKIFNEFNTKLADKIIGMTTTEREFGTNSCQRGWQIKKYLLEHPKIESFVVLDDDNDMDDVRDHFVKTTWALGIEQHHVDECLKCLEKEIQIRENDE